jgi:hypothetical protein
MKDAPRLYVKDWHEAVQVIEVLRLKGFSECYGRAFGNAVHASRKLTMICELAIAPRERGNTGWRAG